VTQIVATRAIVNRDLRFVSRGLRRVKRANLGEICAGHGMPCPYEFKFKIHA
jgi:hypothetical protein